MARPIAPTPQLNAKAAEKFLAKVEEGLKKPTGPIPTPRVEEAIKRVMAHTRKGKK